MGGLKRENIQYYFVPFQVTPFVGVWIETVFIGGDDKTLSHTLRGCVD